ncbi:hypothetical protein F4805DRAFT_423246 [Annulohypoxylon moriforme]|nr:hypothetical protein F4805DRAFT_423246 [Annulohypoxylon moriforme]
MTKQWDMYEATIKDLYAEHTLAVVRQIMSERYGFKASVRAYRGRLIRWGVRKYNCRKRASSDSSGSVHEGSFSSGSNSTSPSMMANSMATGFSHSAGGHLAMPRQINPQPVYHPIDSHQPRMYSRQKPYDLKRKPPILSPPQTQMNNSNMNYGWDTAQLPLPQPKRLSDSSNSTTSDFDNFNAPNNHPHNHPHNPNHNSSADIMAPPTYFGGYGGPVPLTAMGHHTNDDHHNNHGQMNHMNLNNVNNDSSNGNGGGNDGGNNNNNAYAPSAEYLRQRGWAG